MQNTQIIEKMLPQNTKQYLNVFETVAQTGIANDVSMGEILAMRSYRDHYAQKFHYYLNEHAQLNERADQKCVTILDRQEKQQLQKLLEMTSKKYQTMLKICALFQKKHDERVVLDFEMLV